MRNISEKSCRHAERNAWYGGQRITLRNWTWYHTSARITSQQSSREKLQPGKIFGHRFRNPQLWPSFPYSQFGHRFSIIKQENREKLRRLPTIYVRCVRALKSVDALDVFVLQNKGSSMSCRSCAMLRENTASNLSCVDTLDNSKPGEIFPCFNILLTAIGSFCIWERNRHIISSYYRE